MNINDESRADIFCERKKKPVALFSSDGIHICFLVATFCDNFSLLSFSMFACNTTRKHHATVKQENRYIKPERVRKHILVIFSILFGFSSASSRQFMLIEVKLLAKA